MSKGMKKMMNGHTVTLYYRRLMTIDQCLFYSVLLQICLLHCYVPLPLLKYELDVQASPHAQYFMIASCAVGGCSSNHLSYA